MAGAKRTNLIVIMKTFRLTPEVVEDMERVMLLTRGGTSAKYPSMNNFVLTALEELVKKERRMLEQQGVVWDHLKPGINSMKKE